MRTRDSTHPLEVISVTHRRADARRNDSRIVGAAARVLAADPGASMADIAAASGVVRATLYRHFPSREGLLSALVASALDTAETAIAAAELDRGPATEALRRLVDALLAVGSQFRAIIDAPVQDPQPLERATTVGEPIVALIARGQHEGAFRSDLPTTWLAGAVAALVIESLRAIGRGEMSVELAADVVGTTFLEPVARGPLATRRCG